MSKALWKSVPNVGSKVRKSAKATSFPFVALDFQPVGLRRRA